MRLLNGRNVHATEAMQLNEIPLDDNSPNLEESGLQNSVSLPNQVTPTSASAGISATGPQDQQQNQNQSIPSKTSISFILNNPVVEPGSVDQTTNYNNAAAKPAPHVPSDSEHQLQSQATHDSVGSISQVLPDNNNSSSQALFSLIGPIRPLPDIMKAYNEYKKLKKTELRQFIMDRPSAVCNFEAESDEIVRALQDHDRRFQKTGWIQVGMAEREWRKNLSWGWDEDVELEDIPAPAPKPKEERFTIQVLLEGKDQLLVMRVFPSDPIFLIRPAIAEMLKEMSLARNYLLKVPFLNEPLDDKKSFHELGFRPGDEERTCVHVRLINGV